MSDAPLPPDRGYALTPEGPPLSDGDGTTVSGTTAHHEALLHREALAARRGNKAIAGFAVIGLLAAVGVGVVTWHRSVPDDPKPTDRQVTDAATESSLRPPATHASGTPSPGTGTRPTDNSGADVSAPFTQLYSGGGLVPLGEDPYLPPNAWNGGDAITPSTGPRTPDVITGLPTTEDVPGLTPRPDGFPARPTLSGAPPTLATLPPLPGTTRGTASTTGEPNEVSSRWPGTPVRAR